MKAQRRAYSGTYLASILLAWGCTVYESSLLGDRGPSSGGTTAHAGDAGDAGSGGSNPGAAGSAGAVTDGGAGSGGPVGGAGSGAPVGGAGSGDAGESSASAGAEPSGDGGAGVCVPETPAAFCARLGKDCGAVDGTDHCGSVVVAADCGTCSGFARCGGAGLDNVCGVLTDPALGGTVTASSEMYVNEDRSKAFDLNTNTKWFAGQNNDTGWLAFRFPGTASHTVTSYSVTSANDAPDRDPAAWELQGSNTDGAQWTTVDQRSAQVFAARHQTISYTCANTTAYRSYRLLITANNGGPSLQLAELVLYGN